MRTNTGNKGTERISNLPIIKQLALKQTACATTEVFVMRQHLPSSTPPIDD
jgi:hypothetical protein